MAGLLTEPLHGLGAAEEQLGDCPDFRAAKMGLSPSEIGKSFLGRSLIGCRWPTILRVRYLASLSRTTKQRQPRPMEESLKRWFEGDDTPADFYELLGRPRLDPDREELLQAIRNATRVLLLYQNHPQEEKVRRAGQLQRLLGQAADTFSDDEHWLAHDESLLEQMCKDYAEGAGEDAAGWRPAYLRRWLEIVQGVHPGRLEELVERLIPRPAAGTDSSMKEVALYEAELPEDLLAAPPPAPVTPTETPTAPPADQRTARPPAERSAPPGSSGEPPVVRPQQPPGRPTGRQGRGPPPVPPRHPAKSQSPFADTAGRAKRMGTWPRRPMPSRRRPPADSGLPWVVGSAIGTALILGLICIAIILPSVCRPTPSEPPASETDSQTELQPSPDPPASETDPQTELQPSPEPPASETDSQTESQPSEAGSVPQEAGPPPADPPLRAPDDPSGPPDLDPFAPQ